MDWQLTHASISRPALPFPGNFPDGAGYGFFTRNDPLLARGRERDRDIGITQSLGSSF